MKRMTTTIFLALGLLGFASVGLARTIEVVLDAPEYMVKYHSTSITLGLRYASGQVVAQTLFSREELREGVVSKQFNVYDDEELAACSFSWIIADKPHLSIEPHIPLLTVSNPPAQKGSCSWNETGSVAFLKLGGNFDDVTIKVAAEAFENRDAVLLIGKMNYPHLSSPFTFYTPHRSTEWRVHVLTPGAISRTVSLQWSLRNNQRETEEFEALEPTIEIQ
ncbi:MAG: hypothetical protein AB7T49_09135 [Oligoflexales bacterium]